MKRTGLALAAVLWLALAMGCSISRNIVEIDPPPQPSLTELEDNLDYTDPDTGEEDYVIEPGEDYR